MARTRAERRHHAARLKRKRATYNNRGAGTPAHIGMVYRTPCCCSCHMCGHPRRINGMGIQELRARGIERARRQYVSTTGAFLEPFKESKNVCFSPSKRP